MAGRPVRKINPQERIASLREQLETERAAREAAEDQAYYLRGRLARVAGIATIEEESDEEEFDEEEGDEEEDDEEEDDEEEDDEEDDE